MKSHLYAAAFAALAGSAGAGGLDTTGQPVSFLFAQGTVAELGFAQVMPKLSGNDSPLFGGSSTGDIGEDFTLPMASFKHDFTDKFSFGIIIEKRGWQSTF